MLKQVIYVRFMMTSIRALNLLSVLCLSSFYLCGLYRVDMTFEHIPAEDLTYFEQLKTYYPHTTLHITTEEQQSWLGSLRKKTSSGASFLWSAKDIAWFAGKLCFSGTALSYITTLYFLYRIYRIVKKLNSWCNWWSNSNDSLQDEALDIVERMLLKKLKKTITRRYGGKNKSASAAYKIFYKELEAEKQILLLYLRLDNVLKKYRLRSFFPYKNLIYTVQEKLNNLEKVEKLLEVYNSVNGT